ncbi:MAG TPA: response regulator transcription factor [Accumulibacter sp.]|jgi:DNA-binding NarL/FixJ family response regulator|nr:response regulator transcription factor [Accumulibacter sp.]HQC80218.1 response regulator transcription factor [Accumulibacter sp.]
MQQLFLSVDAQRRDSWREAFPDLNVGFLESHLPPTALIWALPPAGTSPETVVSPLRARAPESLLILLSDEPDEDEALAALAAGAAGYCNGHAAPTVLQQAATVVENGGMWIGQALMKRLLSTTTSLLKQRPATNEVWRDTLTAREQDVALAVARGASNKEIARQFNITERTVKFHVSALLEKLGARDRLQLSLIINGVPRLT